MSVYKYLIAGLLITGMSSTASAAGLNYCQNLFSAEENRLSASGRSAGSQ